ncbi:periplasmic heavy metal sensor [Budvicia diplopodorum]|uniref:periplasmic heavy metal sensor n=1 Tax=Budvicia diplopodorum TaxID=1119056 RepID=UPI00135756B2|nr:periplasmic heavy metal sensor [Budvicia diplopodorum]
MNLNKTAIAAVISFAALTGFSSVATSAQHTATDAQQTMPVTQGMDHGNGEMNHQNGGKHHGGKMANMTPEQQAASKKAHDEFVTNTADLRKQMMSKNYEYKALLTASTVDDAKIGAVSKEIAALHDRIAEQRTQLDIQLAKAGVPMMEHRGMGGDRMAMGGKGCH